MPNNDFIDLIVVPSLVVVVVGLAALQLISVLRRRIEPRLATCGAVIGLSAFVVIAVNVLILAAGYYRWEQLVPSGGNHELRLYLCKYGFLAGVGAAMWASQASLRRWTRLLSGLGLSLALLAVVRMLFMWSPEHHVSGPTTTNSAAMFSGSNSGASHDSQSRRVVWIIFDESDYGYIYGPESSASSQALTNFANLSRTAVFATSANSPANATIYSIPALLTGVPIGGDGIHIDRSASLSLERLDGSLLPFDEETTIFGALARRGRSASVLGFYHPYCRLFELQRCNSFPWPQVGAMTEGLWTNAPDFLSNKLSAAYFGDVTNDLLRLLPEYLARDDALTFVHLNIPHLPATYADKVLRLKPSQNLLEEYSRNLVVTDRILGGIVQMLQRQGSQRDVLLVVSADHWLRRWSYGSTDQEVSRAVPFIVWKVGATAGVQLQHPISTVHTSAMVLDYLDGKMTTQSEIAQWWDDKVVYPSFIEPSK